MPWSRALRTGRLGALGADANFRTQALALLRRTNKRFVFVAGLVTSVCVLFTAVSAAQKGYLVAVVEDACADDADAHRTALDGYDFIFERITVDDIVHRHEGWSASLAALDTD
jgi:nicotinamidase-related amidase